MNPSSAPNTAQSALWNDSSGRIWVEMQDILDRLFAPVAVAVVDAAFPGETGSVLDIGCGSGGTSLAMAGRLGVRGRCLGVDISGPLVDAARERARRAQVTNTEFIVADAQTHPFETAAFDAAISRFGVMFFDSPPAAFGNIRQAVKPGGRLSFAAWRSPAENPFMTRAAEAAKPLLPSLPAPDPEAPGQFAFARAERIETILQQSGWTEVAVEALDVPACLQAEELQAYVTRMGPVGLALERLEPQLREQVAEAVMDGFAPFLDGGVARFDLACWRVTARA